MSERLRKSSKKIMAVLVIILMIVFVIDIGVRRGSADLTAKDPIGQLAGGQTLTNADQRQAAAEWQILTRGELGQFTQGRLARALLDHVSLAGQEFMAQFMAMQMMNSTQRVLAGIDERTYLLLVKEAERLGITINRDAAENIRAGLAQMPSTDPETRERAVLNWLNVVEVFSRIAQSVKVSPAQALQRVAQREQQVSLQVVPFSASDLKGQVASPTPEQLQAFFEKYRNVDAETNEFGVGYRFPNRVRIEYVKIPRDAIAKTVSDEDIYKHWKDNQASFQRPPDTQPATLPSEPLGPALPTTAPGTAPATSVASTQPTTRPWTEVKDQIRDILANQRASAMASAVNQIFRTDWPTFREATRTASATQPSAAPTSLGVPYNTYVYLQRLQDRVQKMKESRGVLPELVSEPNLLARKELEELPGIGKARLLTPAGPVSFAQYAIESAEPLLTEADRRQAQENRMQTMALYQPSLPFREEASGNYYIFRLTDAEPAHPAENIGVVEGRVREDWISVQAYELAREAARKFLEEVRAKGLEAAAGDRKVIITGLFRSDTTASLPTYSLSPQATRKLVEGGFNLLTERVQNKNDNPLGVIDLPRAFTSVVARLADATPATKDPLFTAEVFQTQQMLEFDRIHQMMYKWFDPDAVEARVKFQAAAGQASERRQPTPPPPVFPGT